MLRLLKTGDKFIPVEKLKKKKVNAEEIKR